MVGARLLSEWLQVRILHLEIGGTMDRSESRNLADIRNEVIRIRAVLEKIEKYLRSIDERDNPKPRPGGHDYAT